MVVLLVLQVRPPDLLDIQITEPPTIAPPANPTSTTHFSTVQSDVRAGAIRVEISDPEQLSPGEVAILQNQEAKRVREIGSLIFDTPIQHDYEAGVRVFLWVRDPQHTLQKSMLILDLLNPS